MLTWFFWLPEDIQADEYFHLKFAFVVVCVCMCVCVFVCDLNNYVIMTISTVATAGNH